MMKKWLIASIALFGVWSGGASAHGTVPQAAAAKHETLTVVVNGVEVSSEANHVTADGKMYVSIQAFAGLFDASFELKNGNKEAVLFGKTVPNVRMAQGVPTAWVRDLAAAVGAQQVTHDASRNEIYVLALPAGSIKVSDTVPAMGEHWGNPQAGELPIGPFYGVHNGRLVFLEYMIDQNDFESGKNHVNLKGMKGVPSPSVVQVDVEFQPAGHPGFETPHYDIHLYFISDAEQQQIQ
ncbi:hypothetical protein [Paenibacillus sp.]|uniref:hypothetical protein n=1 Tax=Paenibacillus sp. TaxID=58172 RepID=UPI002D4680B5|nr:hypothetical protein [Paenibacillus sp.]HZG56254.1 hypothetical protein [Paenibacillus sp.]